MKDSDILRAVKKHLPSKPPSSRYICWAIRFLDIGTEEQQRKLLLWVSSLIQTPRLDGRMTSLENWLRYYHPDFIRSDDNMLNLRLMWLDWMIQECEKDEK